MHHYLELDYQILMAEEAADMEEMEEGKFKILVVAVEVDMEEMEEPDMLWAEEAEEDMVEVQMADLLAEEEDTSEVVEAEDISQKEELLHGPEDIILLLVEVVVMEKEEMDFKMVY